MGVLDRFIESFKYLDLGGLKKLAALTERMFRFKAMPDPAARWEGKLVQYIGPTNAAYHRGYFYTCVDNAGTYEWQRTDTQPNGDIVLWDGTHAQYEVEQDGIPEGAYLNFTDDYDSNVEVGVYATRETKTGELLFNKPVYRKCFLVTTPSTIDTTPQRYILARTGIPKDNLQYLKKCDVLLRYHNVYGEGWCLNNWGSDGDNVFSDCILAVDSESDLYVRAQIAGTHFASQPCIITLEYTKITD